jgi:cytochrome c-type biogenesis protein
MSEVTYPLAFLAGVLSFLSPCVLPLVPSFVSFITGISFEDLTSHGDRRRVRFLTITNSLVFILGFSAVFITLGAFSSLLGNWFFKFQDAIRIGGGVLIIIFGLFITNIIKLDFLMKEKKFKLHGKPAGYIGTFLVGMTFAAGWTPCIGPILGAILLVASSQGSTAYGLKLLTVYSLGLGVPFFLSAVAFNAFLSSTKTIYRFMRPIKVISGVILILFGVILLTDNLGLITGYFPNLGIEF